MTNELKEISLEDTLEDDIWMDSFDKLLKARPVLRDLNVLKKDVHASLNIDSSVENSIVDNCDMTDLPQKQTLVVTSNCNSSISTPLTKIRAFNPFICSLSPIGAWQYRFFDNLQTNNDNSNVQFSHGTPNKPEMIVEENNSLRSDENLSVQYVKEKELSLLPIPNKETREKQRRIRFQSILDKTNSSKIMRSSAPVSYKNASRANNTIVKPDKAKKPISVSRRSENSKNGKSKSTLEFCAPSVQIGKRKSKYVNPAKECESKSGVLINNSKENDKDMLGQRTSNHFDKLCNIEILINSQRAEEDVSDVVLTNQNDALEKEKHSLLPIPHKETNETSQHVCSEITADDTILRCRSSTQSISSLMKTGKWRKSLNAWRRTQNLQNGKPKTSNIYVIAEESVEICNVSMRIGNRKSMYIKSEADIEAVSYKECQKQVLARCQQRVPKQFNKLYNEDLLENCRKIGEGAYGEVFINNIDNADDAYGTVMKIIPIDGEIAVNGEVQKTFEQILPEIVITMELSNLDSIENPNSTIGFVKINRVTCVKGKYPTHLVNLWEAYDEEKTSENDHPAIFTNTQLYIVLELEYGGQDLEKFEFTNAEQSYYIFQQLAISLAVAEEVFQFEHRDLHWGNILIKKTTEKHFQYKLNGELVTLPSKGIKASIIDYTLSRMTYGNYVYYNDISKDDELFEATGDYQFDIYRMMKTELKNEWDVYKPKTNIFWLSYVAAKLINDVKYKNKRAKIHTTYIKKLKQVKEYILNYDSVGEFAREFIIAK
ncbi:serine/threonine-protein kinase haspin homolog [Teleopsis dalmanni]|uniref:serine/threonine-protein kinase haspin homolog n=1 Tax=Teleopsis dalmanni TaxID=139649 RepID=UPI0018CCE246|nr:serine/threonine-protein kinase haspin homolog [Teleopsis dalmanni]